MFVSNILKRDEAVGAKTVIRGTDSSARIACIATLADGSGTRNPSEPLGAR